MVKFSRGFGGKVQIERIEIDKLHSDPANARKHDERNIDAIAGSLIRFGQQKPVVIDRANIVRAGNGTLVAAKSLGWTHLDCVRTPLDGSEAIAYAIADNRTAELAAWDDDTLAANLQGLLDDDAGLLVSTGFSEQEIDALLGDSEQKDTELKPLSTKAPPAMAWVLLGIPTIRFGDIASDVERLASIVEICETTVTDAKD
jgi:ParB-like chromosome segregation protein Spo0J